MKDIMRFVRCKQRRLETYAIAIHPFNDRLTIPGVLTHNGYGYDEDTYEKMAD